LKETPAPARALLGYRFAVRDHTPAVESQGQGGRKLPDAPHAVGFINNLLPFGPQRGGFFISVSAFAAVRFLLKHHPWI
jgi:hypothetical protein